MKVLVTTRTNCEGEESNLEISIITETFSGSAGFGEGEKEDMYLSRDLNDVYYLEPIVRAAYEAGKRGESYELFTENGDE